jgi:hypothetical protein
MKHDRSKYMPDVGKVLQETDPATFDERQRKALEKVREAGLIERLTPEPAARVSAPSPWAAKGDSADGASAEIDKAALPSAMGPVATRAEEPQVTTVAKPKTAVRRWPVSWKVMAGGALLTVAALGMLVGMIVMHVKEPADKAPAMPSATAMPSTTAMEEAVPNAWAIPSAEATASVTAMPSATAVPRVKLQGKPRAVSDDPYDAAVPIAPVTATPAVTPAPIVTAAPLVTTPPAASAAAPFLLRKRDP